MNFLGIDFGWYRRPSGLVHLSWEGKVLRVEAMECQNDVPGILNWVDKHAGKEGPCLVAVDAPLIIPNKTGKRVPDRLTHVYFGKYHAGAFPANQGRPFASRTTKFSNELKARGFTHADTIAPREPSRFQIEVFPHPAIVNLFGLQRILKYKKGSVAERRAQLDCYRSLIIERLPALVPGLEPPKLPATPPGGTALKELEDKLDALVCAYVGAHWWYWGLERNHVLGCLHEGYIIVPIRVPEAHGPSAVEPQERVGRKEQEPGTKVGNSKEARATSNPNPRRLVFRVHAIQRMFERKVTKADVRRILTQGEVIEEYPSDTPYPSRLMLGWLGERPLHVVIADNTESDETIVITAYEPDPAQWDASFGVRRKA